MPRRLSNGGDALRGWRSRLLRGLSLLGLAFVVLLAGGCVTTSPLDWLRNGLKVGPNYRLPAAPLAEEWIQAKDHRTHGPPPRNGEWWDTFQDPILNYLIYRAYQQNPTLRSVGTRVLQARAQQAIAVGNIFPQSQRLLGLYPNGTFAGGPKHIDLTAFNLTWELDFWGKYRRQVESARAKQDASVGDYDDALVTLLADVATNYVQYRVAQQRIEIARYNLGIQKKLVAVAQQQQKVGTATSLDVEQLRTLMEQTGASIPALQIVLGQANDKLCILVGEPPRDLEGELGPAPKLGRLPMAKTPASVAAGIPADLLLRRPDIRSAERKVAAQSAQIAVAEADLYPSLSIGTMLGYANIGLAPILATNGGLAFIIPQFSWNLLNYGRIVNNIRLQDAKTQELIAAYQAKVLTAAQEVQTALRGFLRSQEQSDGLARSATAAVTATKVEEQLFSRVKADVNRLFTLANSQLQVQDQLAIAQGNIALNLINVYRALGGGWEIRFRDDPWCRTPISTLVSEAGPHTDSPQELPQPKLLPPR